MCNRVPWAPRVLGVCVVWISLHMTGLVLMRPESKEGRMQKGLMRVEANPSGRRMVAVPLGQAELWALVKVG